jgi:hypothetical protein
VKIAMKLLSVVLLLFGSVTSAMSAQTTHDSSPSECTQTAKMDVYSNAYLQTETGDLLGYDLAISKPGDVDQTVLFYVYEGGLTDRGIPLSVIVQGKNLLITGEWTEELIEYPSQRKIAEKHRVRLELKMVPKALSGTVYIEGMADRQPVRLRLVRHVWSCASEPKTL